MARKRLHEEHERWLVSYADFITLLDSAQFFLPGWQMPYHLGDF
jgi:flagellar motor protein MotB